MEVSFAAAAFGLAVLAAGAVAALVPRWRRARDRDALVALLGALHVLLVAGTLAAVLAPFPGIRAGLLPLAAACAWLAYLAWHATPLVLPRDAPAAGGGAPLVLRATLAGAACGVLTLAGLGVAFVPQDGLGVLVLLALYGTVPALLAGAAMGLALGLVDLAALAAVRRAAR